MSDVIGKATLQFAADGSSVKSEVREIGQEVNAMAATAAAASVKAAGSLTGIGSAAEGASQKLTSSQLRARQSLERMAATLGRTRAEVAEYRATAAGLPREVFEPLVAKIREAEAAMGGMSVAQRTVASSGVQLAESEAAAAARVKALAAGAIERAEALHRQAVEARATAAAERELATAAGGVRTNPLGTTSSQNRGFQELTRDINEVNSALSAIERGAGSQTAIQAQTEKLVSLWAQGRLTAEQYSGAIKRLDASEAALARSSAQASAQGDRFIAGLREQAETAGLTARQLLEYRAAQLGVGDRAAPLISRLAQVNKNLDGTGVSARQTAAALRMVPAQMTDIATQVAGGQNPFLILIQQGGQLKDSFGGIGPMFRALLGMITPFSLAIGGVAATVGAFSVAMYQGASESRAFETALTLTGNAVGKTSGQLKDMSRDIAGVGVSQGKAAEVVVQLVNSGKVASAELEKVSAATALMSKTGARSVDDLVGEFARLAEAPSATLLKLNEQYHFLTAAVYKQVAALELEGRSQQAAALAQATYADAVKSAADRIIVQMGPLQRMWDDLKTKAKDAWSAMKNLGSDRSIGDIQKDIDYYSDALGKASNGSSEWYFYRSQLGRFVNEASAAQLNAGAELDRAEGQAAEDRKTRAQALLNQIDRETRSRKEIRDQEIAQVTEASRALGETEEALQKRIAKINEKYKDPKGAAVTDGAGVRMLADLREREASLSAQLAAEKKLTDAGKTRVEFEQQIADLKGKAILTADQRSLLANQDAIRAQLEKNEGLAKELVAKQELIKLEERSAQIQQAMASAGQSRREQYDRQLSTVGMGQQARERAEAENSIRQEYRRYEDQLAKATPKDQLGSEQYQIAQGKIRESLNGALEDQRSYYAQIDSLNSNWRNGFTESFADYQAQAGNVAQQAQGVFTNAFKGMEDALVNFATTGKLKFKEFAASILADLARIATRQAVVGMVGSLVGVLGAGASSISASSSVSMGPAVNNPGIAGWDEGGFTGPGGKYEPAGIVHRGEYVFDQDSVRAAGGPSVLDKMRKQLRGFSSGGFVGAAGLAPATSRLGGGSAPNVSVSVVVHRDGTREESRENDEGAAGALANSIVATIDQQIAKSWGFGGISYNQLRAQSGRR
jgi:lambda family phage tail tape measure protein